MLRDSKIKLLSRKVARINNVELSAEIVRESKQDEKIVGRRKVGLVSSEKGCVSDRLECSAEKKE